MNMLLKTTAAAAMMIGFAAPAFGQSANGTGNTAIVAPLSITAGDTLEFGSVARPATGSGSVTINAVSGAQTLSGGVISVSGGTTPRRGTFNVTGEGTRTFTTTVPGTLTLNSGGNSITVNLTSDAPTALTAGAATIGIGGNFTLPSTQASGSYTGTYAVSVAYN